MECPRCEDTDLSLIGYVKVTDDLYEVAFECRQCRYSFTIELNDEQLNFWR